MDPRTTHIDGAEIVPEHTDAAHPKVIVRGNGHGNNLIINAVADIINELMETGEIDGDAGSKILNYARKKYPDDSDKQQKK